MCSIFGIQSKSIASSLMKECFERTISRGPDMSRFMEIPCGYLGFHRLAIMGLDERGMQPFQLDDDYVVCNAVELLQNARKHERQGKEYHRSDDPALREVLFQLNQRKSLPFINTTNKDYRPLFGFCQPNQRKNKSTEQIRADISARPHKIT